MKGLIDSAATQERQIALLWQAVQKLSEEGKSDCMPSDAAREENFAADKLNQLLGK
jgi:serine O-acetyltransferase